MDMEPGQSNHFNSKDNNSNGKEVQASYPSK